MTVDKKLAEITDRIVARSGPTRDQYLAKMAAAAEEGPRRAHLTCGNQAHAFAATGQDKDALVEGRAPNIGIITAYNDMLSAHQPYETYPQMIKDAARKVGATAQVAGGVPAMCDGVTQGQTGMDLSLFSRDVIALAAGVGLSHNTYDGVVYLGICDKIVPGLVMAAATFGFLPGIFLPSGPMPSGIPNDEKAKVRQEFATGKCGRDALMKAEMASYHGPGTCTFYGTANSNQMLMEMMGLQLPGSSFVAPGTDLRDALNFDGVARLAHATALGQDFRPVSRILDEKAFVNGIVGLMATGGSTNLILHLPAMARAAGIVLELSDFSDISAIVPLLARVYPNGLADVNHFHAAGGMGYVIRTLLDAGLLHEDVETIAGSGLSHYANEPVLQSGELSFRAGAGESLNTKILRPAGDPFKESGGLSHMSGNLGDGVIKVSAVSEDRHRIAAPARVFDSQDAVKAAFKAGELDMDVVVVVRFQGPMACGMPELHGLTPVLSVLQDRGHKVALLTDGRMSGASGKVPAIIHLCPEAASGGPIAYIKDGDLIEIDVNSGTLVAPGLDLSQEPANKDLSDSAAGLGRELFSVFRENVGIATTGAAVVI